MTPEGWLIVSLQDLVYFQEGPGLRKWLFREDGMPFINIRCIQDGRLDLSQVQFIDQSVADEKYAHFKLDDGDTVVSSSGTLGRVAVITAEDLPLMLNTSVIRFRTLDENQMNTGFMRHYLRAEGFRSQILNFSQGSAQPNFGPSHLSKVIVLLPPLPEQRKIAAILSSVDEAIDGTQAVIDQLQVVKKAMMAELLTRGIPGRHTKFKTTEIGEVPEDWEVVAIECLCSHIVDCPHETPIYTPVGYPVIRTADVVPGRILIGQAKRTSESVYRSRIRRLEPLSEDVLYSREGERFGIAAPVSVNTQVCLGQRMMHFRASSETDPSYLCWLLNSPTVYGQAVGGVGGSTSPHVNVGDIKRFLVPRPPQNEQRTIGQVFSEMEICTEVEEQMLIRLVATKSALMSVLLTGEVRVQPDGEAA